MPPDRFAILVQGHLDGTLDAAGRDELATGLDQDPVRIDELLDQTSVATACAPGREDLRERLALLLDQPGGKETHRLATSRRFTRRRPSMRPWLAAALVVVATGTLAWFALARPAPAVPSLLAQAGDMVVRAGGTLTPIPDREFPLAVGDRIEIQGGGARLVWPDGATIAWASAAQAAIPDAAATLAMLAIDAGEAVCEIPHRPERAFRITVPQGTVTDRGTSFTLRVRATETTIAVRSGVVALQAPQQPPVTVAAGSEGLLRPEAASLAPQTVEALGFAEGTLFAASTRSGWQIWGIRSQVGPEDGIPTLAMEPHGQGTGSWLMRTCYDRSLDWSQRHGVRFQLRGNGAVCFQLEDNQQPGGTPQQNELFASPWQEATADWRLVAIPFTALRRSSATPLFLEGRALPDDGLGLRPVRAIGFRLRDAGTRVAIRELGLF